jgi:hypothetical protein
MSLFCFGLTLRFVWRAVRFRSWTPAETVSLHRVFCRRADSSGTEPSPERAGGTRLQRRKAAEKE